MKVLVRGYEQVKYIALEQAFKVEYDDVEDWEVKVIPKEEILAVTDESGVDEYDEYLILTFADGDTSTFRNSHVDLFIIG